MSFEIEELKPKNPILIIDSKEIELSIITLKIDVIFKEQYGGLSKIFDVVNETPEKLIDIVWELVIDKPKFKSNLEVFKKFVYSSRGSIATWAKDMTACLYESINKSQPLIKNLKRYKELQDINGAQSSDKPCYGAYYDAIAKRYSYTLEEFYQLTLRQLHILLKVIGNESHKELEIQASLHGRELKQRMNFQDITPEEDEDQDNQALKRLAEMQKEYEEKSNTKEQGK